MALLDLEVSICIHILSDLCYLNFQIEKEKAMQWLRSMFSHSMPNWQCFQMANFL